ncbi:MAG: tail fiber domain-containing protein [Flavisolibacter sp.]
MKKTVFYTLLILLISPVAFAQSWNLTGNNNASPTSILGTTNSVPLRLFTKNLVRLTIDTFGFVGINSAHPVSTLDVRGTQYLSGVLKFGTGAHGLQFANPTLTANKAMMYMFTSGTTNLPRMVIAHSPAFPNQGLQFDDATDNFTFIGNGVNVMTVGLNSLNVGIQTNAPGFPLNFADLIGDKISLFGNSGAHYGFGIQDNTLQMHTNSASSDIVFGYGSSFALTERMRIKGGGRVEIGGVAAPSNYRLYINHDLFGIGIQHTGLPDYWEYWMSSDKSLYLFYDNSVRGSFNPTTGAYTALSDARFKNNVKPMESVLDKIKQLKPSSYQFKNTKDQQFYDGFIAQDVLPIFPNLVTHNVDKERKIDLYTMNYAGFGVIAIKAIQEQQDHIQQQDEKINALTEQIKELKEMVNRLAPGQFQNVNAVSSLEQNSPNPARSTTSIAYKLPANNGSAQLQLIDNLGRTVKTLQLNSSGRIYLDVSALTSGTYSYSLIVDGKIIETKKLVKASD